MAGPPPSHPYKRLAAIFANMNRAKQDLFLKDLEQRDAQAAEQIRALMFTFEDLVRLEPRGVQELLRQIDPKTLAAALKGASPQVQELFFDNMSERGATLLREDMDAMAPLRRTEVEKAQTSIVATAKALAKSGKIIITDNTQDAQDEYVT